MLNPKWGTYTTILRQCSGVTVEQVLKNGKSQR